MAEVFMASVLVVSIFLAVLPESANRQDAVKAALEVIMILAAAATLVVGAALAGFCIIHLLQLAGFSVGDSR